MELKPRTIPAIWIDPRAIRAIRQGKNKVNQNQLRNIYLSLCEMEYYSLTKFNSFQTFLLRLKDCSREEIEMIELCFKELEVLNLVKSKIDSGQYVFSLLETILKKEKVNINSVVPIPVKEKPAQSKATETNSRKGTSASTIQATEISSSKGTKTNMPVSTLVPLKKDPRIKESIDYFFQRCYEIKGFKPEISGASEGRMIKEKLKRYSIDEMKEAFDWFLESEESENLGCTIKLCLSNYIFNKWLAQRVY